jgi:hypothetical protein
MADVTGNDFLDRLLDQAPPEASQPKRGQNYNYPTRLYLKPDGRVVTLQGDPGNRAYYQDKGYHLLSDTPGRAGGKSELRQYVEDEYPKLLAEQREKAAIINAIRKANERDRNLNLEDTFDDYTVDELRTYLKQIKEETGKDIRVVVPKRAAARQAADEARLIQGVETADEASIEGLQSKLERGREATLQGTGYDPIDQARRRSTR